MVGKETVQLYLRENFDYEGKSEKHWMLKRFKKVEIAPGTVVRVKFSLKGVDFRHVLPPPGQTNEIELRVGPLHRSDLDRKVKILVTQPHTFPITQPDNRPDEAVVEVRNSLYCRTHTTTKTNSYLCSTTPQILSLKSFLPLVTYHLTLLQT